MKIEATSPDDIPAMAELCRAAHKESRYGKWPFSEEMVRQMLTAPFAMKCIKKHDICGFFLGTLTHMEFSPRPIGMQVLFWVKPEYRGSSAFYLLVTAFLDWCRHKSAVPMIAPHFAIDNAKTYRMLEKLGLTEFGKIYSKEDI